MKSPMTDEDVKELTRRLYKVFFTPRYIVRRITSIREVDDLRFIYRGSRSIFGHLRDFSHA